ncbi:MAG: hypothetical protein Q8L74_09460 [Nitrospirota bacterium]|nr:hypothetical protein [Nitrospirota bacterium]MDP2382674.1 hypothetical protein [Nitrospirota bacterium]
MMLHPLTEVGIGMLVPIVIGRRQLVMNVLRHGKRSNGQQEQNKTDRHSTP